jgi:UDP-2,4-diacetamido-2,4,6-trideoxy-beta-L-altropyranose hydrolase
MKVAIRVDSSYQIGTGHLMRCLTLADYLSGLGADAVFFSRDLPGNLRTLIRSRGFGEIPLQGNTPKEDLMVGRAWEDDLRATHQALRATGNGFDWIVVDHYGLDARWEAPLHREGKRLMVIDDMADRPHDCDLLLDTTPDHKPGSRYARLVPSGCRLLLGPRYALLRREFLEASRRCGPRKGPVANILLFLGGNDPDNQTAKALEAMCAPEFSAISVDLVVGAANRNRAALEAASRNRLRTRFHCQTDQMAQLMAAADVSIGAGGTASWERCVLGLPALIFVLAPNQGSLARAIEQAGAGINLGDFHHIGVRDLVRKLRMLMTQPGQVRAMSEKALALINDGGFIGGEGVARMLQESI